MTGTLVPDESAARDAPIDGGWSRRSPRSRLMSVVETGVDRTGTLSEARWVRTLNVIALAAGFLSTMFAVFYAYLDLRALWMVSATNLIWVVGYVWVIRNNRAGRPRRATLLMLVTGWLNVLIPAAALGASTGIYLFMVLVPLIGVLVSPPGAHMIRALIVIVGVLGFATVPMLFPDSPASFRGTTLEQILFATAAIGVAGFGCLVSLYYRQLVESAEKALAEANARSEELLLNILPGPIAERLKAGESPIADRIDEVTVLFADLVDFTPLSEGLEAGELVALLDTVFSEFDELSERYGLEKIATMGDGYLAVAGLPLARADHMAVAADMALAMCVTLSRHRGRGYGDLRMRFGLASGTVVAGVIGKKKIRYDLWGDTVNTASRMESHGEPGKVHVTADLFDALRDEFEFEPRGVIPIKGKGLVETYFLVGRRVDLPHPGQASVDDRDLRPEPSPIS